MSAENCAVAEPISTVVDAAVPDAALSIDELGSRIVGLAGRVAAATCRWLLLVAEFDARDGCARFGLATTARWVSHYCGLSHRTAVEHVRVAKALAAFPELAREMSAGRLSYSQVRAISRVPADGEHQVVRDLIELAEHGTAAHLETVARGVRTVERNERGAEPTEEYVKHGWTNASMSSTSARLLPERGAFLHRAIEQVARAEGLTHTDALVRMAEIALAAVDDAANPPRQLRGDERAAVVVHIDAASYPVGNPAEEEPRSAERAAGHVADGPGLPKSVIDRLLCSGGIRTAVHGRNGNVRSLGRSHRTVTRRQFHALLMRDKHCTHPGCGSRAGLEAHHVRHWIYGGHTNLDNLVLLCGRHHRGHHEGEFAIEALGHERFRFLRADGRVLADHQDATALAAAAGPLEAEIDIADNAATTRWGGERLQREWAVSVLAQRRANAQRLAAAAPLAG